MKYAYCIAALPLLLAACESGDVKETLGLTRESPDEFVVVSRPPLSVPPDFQLVAPDPAAKGPQRSAEQMAKSALLGKSTEDAAPTAIPLPDSSLFSTPSEFTLEGVEPPNTAVAPVEASGVGSAAESFLLERAQADKADPEVRAKLRDAALNPPEPKEQPRTLYERLTGAESEEPVVDAKKEAERLRANKDKGKKPNEGDVPTSKKKNKSVLDGLW